MQDDDGFLGLMGAEDSGPAGGRKTCPFGDRLLALGTRRFGSEYGQIVEGLARTLGTMAEMVWPESVVKDWISGAALPSRTEADLICRALHSKREDLPLPGDASEGMPDRANEAGRKIRDALAAARALRKLAASHQGPAVLSEGRFPDRLRLALICRGRLDGDADLTWETIFPQLRHLVGTMVKEDQQDLLNGPVPEAHLVQEIARTCGVEACFLTGKAWSVHSFVLAKI